MPKIQALQGSIDSKVLPLLTENGIEVVQEEDLMLTHVFEDSFRINMLNSKSIGRMDHRHWYYEDELFAEYVHTIASFQLPAVCLFESPFGHELPNVDIHLFEKKLYERTRLAANAFRINSPGTKIISPAICLVHPKYQERYLDYFIHNRSFFDIYGLHCIYDMKEQTLGLLTAFLNQVLSALRKPVWVTRWAAPSCEHPIENPFAITASTWQPSHYSDAAAALRSGFRAINEVTKDTQWFFTGFGKDDYDAAKDVPSIWEKSTYPVLQDEVPVWDFYHFLGAVTYQGQLKQPILDAFFEIAQKNNE